MTMQKFRRLLTMVAAASVFTLSAAGAHAVDNTTAVAPVLPIPPPAGVAPLAPVAPPPPAREKVPEGTEIHLQLGERLSSATASVGDTFQVTSDEEIKLPDGTILPAGYAGKGEVTIAEKTGIFGKSGELGIRMNYLRIGDARVRLRSNKSGEGKSGVTNAVVVTILFGPLGLLVHGHSIIYPKGQEVIAYVDQDTQISLPVPPPPKAN